MTIWAPLRQWASLASLRPLATELAEAGVPPERPVAALRVPGRLEIFGKHTDYAGGRSLVAATEPGITLLVGARDDSGVRWLDAGRGVAAGFDLARTEARPGHWSNYLRTVARRLARDLGPLPRGVDVAMASDLPSAAGLSSSSALVVACFLALDAAGELRQRLPWSDGEGERLADYLGAVEGGHGFETLAGSGGVGTFGGSEDHAAILGSRKGRLRHLRFGPLQVADEVELDPRRIFAIGVSGVHADKTGEAREPFNRLATLAREIVEIWRWSGGGDEPDLGSVLAASGGVDPVISAIGDVVDDEAKCRELEQRLRHFALESEVLVPAATAAFGADDVETLGRLSAESQRRAEEWLGNQTVETAALVKLARHQGAAAATAFGGGFGGAVWALVERSRAEQFLRRWEAAYREACPVAAEAGSFLLTGAGGGAAWLEPETGESGR